MSRTYDMIAGSLNELIADYEENNGANLTHETLTINIAPARKFSGAEVRSIRLKNNLTQAVLAKYLCVSKKTIEAWESGRNTPNGPSSRLLELLDRQAVSIVTA
ncbi:helix-turn-helix domain-containing protein [Selenomonas sp. AB3002]|uniref:helix-turn-helix domain-containing protein n=1 Tax=Selenomonas sp. AB3002 TaxID=1392502 RepID=UPI000497890E